ncbi:hypothetical protein, partial [Mesorhizobium sp. M4B.F.Ca.ET.211.01.1.1]|uniref:hypothetical protein n=1 Tax=Mesorhizobium sp. M4B.F.Ca.ET.211.01.1.1 TaxID=2563954 RepID=UPI001AEE7EAB
MISGDARLFDEGIAYLAGQREAVATAPGDAVACRLLGRGGGPVGALVEIQQHRTFGSSGAGGCRG